MLHSLLPNAYRRYVALPLLGPAVDGFDDWLTANSYTRWSRKLSIYMLPRVDADLRDRGVKVLAHLTPSVLRDSWKTLLKNYPARAGVVCNLERYLAANGLIAANKPATAPSSILIEGYANYLIKVHGFASSTVSHHRYTAQCFLQHLDHLGIALKKIQARHLESYVVKTGKRISRASLQHDIGALKGFLRFLALDGRVSAGLDRQIDTPRLYRFETLPRALLWETVQSLLRSIDRTSALGLRDYAMFLLIATYGLRSSEVAAITLDDVLWRQGRLRIHQRKTYSPLELPLTNEVSTALMKHLKRTPPPKPYRRIFLRMRAPIDALKPSAIAEAFRSRIRKSGLDIAIQGPHCLRHSLATHLLKKETSFKTIGDILGHRSPASTLAYLRMATEDLREVPLPLPRRRTNAKEGQR